MCDSFSVIVTRYYEDESSVSYFGRFASKVFAVKDNLFLVYDPGEGDEIVPHFEWIDFTEAMREIINGDRRVSIVELVEGDGHE